MEILDRRMTDEEYALFKHERSLRQQEAERERRIHREKAVVACVHDLLIPAEYRGPHIPLADKDHQLHDFVQRWGSTVAAQADPDVQKLGRRLIACPPYCGHPRKPCRSSVCPHCFARWIDSIHRSLLTATDLYLNVLVLIKPGDKEMTADDIDFYVKRYRGEAARSFPTRFSGDHRVITCRPLMHADGLWRFHTAALVASKDSNLGLLSKYQRHWVVKQQSYRLTPATLEAVLSRELPYRTALLTASPGLVNYYDKVVKFHRPRG